jgi:phenylalanyl-tRNA synthetase alpha chain
MSISNILESGKIKISNLPNLRELEALRIEFFGKSGLFNQEMQKISSLPAEEKKSFGAEVNNAKNILQDLLLEKKGYFDNIELEERLKSEKLDITLPGRQHKFGSLHPTMQAMEELTAIFCSLGFEVKEGSSIEDDWHNFTALNIPEDHPARQMHDTFYMKTGGSLLRTHTSPIQIRTMQNAKPPFKIIAPGRVYRCDYDVTHTPMFHQLEILHIDKNLHMGHLRSLISEFLDAFFEKDNIPVRMRPSFFPFTEPSVEVDIGCSRKNGQFSIGSGDSWLEIMGCGMVHPNVLRNVGIDPEEYQGYALGMGLDRMAMLKYGISDLRAFFSGDQRWINHYNFPAIDIPSLIGGLTK